MVDKCKHQKAWPRGLAGLLWEEFQGLADYVRE